MQPNLKNIPSDPGVYQFFNAAGDIIYIGKAKNLNNRVRSYWNNFDELEPAKQDMIRRAARVEYIVVNTETEALLLEAGLIKKHAPPYNIVLRDDKDWTYIVITGEPFPRIVTVHGNRRIKGDHFGPYTSAAAAKTVVRLLHQILPLRTCKRDLSKLPNGLVCMQYHLGRCLGPCEKKIGIEAYMKLIQNARDVLKGDTKPLIREMLRDMNAAARTEHFEKAALLRNRMRALERISERQQVVSAIERNQDFIGLAYGEKETVLTVMQIRNGRMLDTLHYVVQHKLDETEHEVLEQFLIQHYAHAPSRPAYVLLPFSASADASKALAPVVLAVPKRGRNKRLRDLAQKNAWVHYHKKTSTKPLPPALYVLKHVLSLPALPRRIEAYDISNIGGSYAVGAMVVALDGSLAPAHYRKFKIRTIHGSDDVRMMREMLQRRTGHPKWGEPDLLVLDGGKPQLSMVFPVLPKRWQTKIVALAKREEELFLPGRSASIRLDTQDAALLLLRKIRDAVHNQAIRYYRKVHRKEWKK
ncbi:MAG: excinuclease ABC subunit C [Candidatus Komeilibacteria bacterium RIFCSPHIGHO2_01_FULL_52_14]|uniref:Excinuclease ABC subunit C n=2 Tax=Candidatus Komeiliibacteriota TaxID=1817908 RepID=A0A1G2BNV7_9BACT|nr:MAG: excinuclease ABC subunit C [Candidatus Komeilibacteria bacterium RIFCSPHIGHO2_01_FULL_52_14]